MSILNKNITKNLKPEIEKPIKCLFYFVTITLIMCSLGNSLAYTNLYSGVILFAFRLTVVSLFLALCAEWNFNLRFLFLYGGSIIIFATGAYMPLCDGRTVYYQEVFNAIAQGTFFFGVLYSFFSLASYLHKAWQQYVAIGIFSFFYLILIIYPVIGWGYYFATGSLVSGTMLQALLQTNPVEVKAFVFSQFNMSWALFLVLILALAILFIRNNYILLKNYKGQRLLMLVLISVLALVCCYAQAPIFADHFLAREVADFKKGMDYENQFVKTTEERQKHQDKLREMLGESKHGTFVLVIGESAYSKHMGVYGYARNNTPWMSKMMLERGSILVQHAYSSYGQTAPALKYALSEKNQYNNIDLKKAYTIIELAKASGYKTYWLSNQPKYGFYGTPISLMGTLADEQVWLNTDMDTKEATKKSYDDKLLPVLPAENSVDNKFIIIHIEGSHFLYKNRYPSDYDVYTANDKNYNIAAYDNSILYTDHILQEIYERVSKYPDFKAFIYMSDHGEDVDAGKAHGNFDTTFPMLKIPFFIKLSDSFIKERPETYQTLKQHQNVFWTNDLLHDLLQDLMGIKNIHHLDPKFDLASPAYYGTPQNLKTIYGQKSLSEDPGLK